ncbi:MAG: bacillithiol biosynthesis cysteine-adding enzyme BshC [bacterium]|nr:bacillithiol biosynthesis cysteine-adding enzyme BshC [bacterium]
MKLRGFQSVKVKEIQNIGFVNDYITAPDLVKDYFHYLPDEVENFMEDLKTRVSFGLGSYLWQYNQEMGAKEDTLKNIEHLTEKRSFVIMTGQQPGLLTGPLYSIYKAIHAIKLANSLSFEYQTKFIPIFWNESQDSDWKEVNHFNILADGEIQRLEFQTDREGLPFGDIPIEDYSEFLDKVDKTFPTTKFKTVCLDLIKDTANSAVTFSDWFTCLLLQLFSDYGLVVVCPSKRPFKRLLIPFYQKELEDPIATTTMLNKAGDLLEARGYKRKIHKKPLLCNFFLKEDGKRENVTFEGAEFRTQTHTFPWSKMLEILKSEPERFSTGVALRPVAASFLFPIIGYVAGPNELCYFAQLKEVFSRHGLKMPIIFPRTSLTILEPGVTNVLEKHLVRLSSLIEEDIESFINRRIKEKMGREIDEKFLNVKHEVSDLINNLNKIVKDYDQTLCASLDKLKGRFAHDLEEIEDKIVKGIKKREMAFTQQIYKIKNSIYPDNSLQERTLNIFHFLLRYGLDFIKALFNAFPLDYYKHHFLSLELEEE